MFNVLLLWRDTMATETLIKRKVFNWLLLTDLGLSPLLPWREHGSRQALCWRISWKFYIKKSLLAEERMILGLAWGFETCKPTQSDTLSEKQKQKKQLYLLFHLRQYHSLMAKHSSTWAYWQVRNILICTTPRGLGDASLVEDIYSLVWFLRLEILFTCNSFYALWLHLKCELQISAPFFMTKNYCHNRLQVLWNCKLLCLMVVSCYVSWYFFITK